MSNLIKLYSLISKFLKLNSIKINDDKIKIEQPINKPLRPSIKFEPFITKGFSKDSHTSLMRQILNNSDGVKTGDVSINLLQYLQKSEDTVRNTLTWAIHLKSITINNKKS